MAKSKFRKLTPYLIFLCTSLLLAHLIPLFRTNTIDLLELPLVVFSWFRREAGAIIYYRRNFSENIRLKKELSILKQKVNSMSELATENVRLAELLALKKASPLKLVAARVIGRAPDNWSSIIIIDKGNNNGILSGMAVITYQGLVGKVIETGSSTSKAMLITDPNLGVSALLASSREEGLVSGTLEQTLIMRYLSVDSEIKESDAVITSGLSQVYPKGIIIGKVKSVGTQFRGLSRYAIIKPAVNFSSLEEVLVVIDK